MHDPQMTIEMSHSTPKNGAEMSNEELELIRTLTRQRQQWAAVALPPDHKYEEMAVPTAMIAVI
jgi:hypothetical protein